MTNDHDGHFRLHGRAYLWLRYGANLGVLGDECFLDGIWLPWTKSKNGGESVSVFEVLGQV